MVTVHTDRESSNVLQSIGDDRALPHEIVNTHHGRRPKLKQPTTARRRKNEHDVELTLSHQRIALHSPYNSKLKILDDAFHVLSRTTCTLLLFCCIILFIDRFDESGD